MLIGASPVSCPLLLAQCSGGTSAGRIGGPTDGPIRGRGTGIVQRQRGKKPKPDTVATRLRDGRAICRLFQSGRCSEMKVRQRQQGVHKCGKVDRDGRACDMPNHGADRCRSKQRRSVKGQATRQGEAAGPVEDSPRGGGGSGGRRLRRGAQARDRLAHRDGGVYPRLPKACFTVAWWCDSCGAEELRGGTNGDIATR